MRNPKRILGVLVFLLLLPSAASRERRKRTSAWPFEPAVAAHGLEASGGARRPAEEALPAAAKTSSAAVYGKLPLGFEENRGQTDKRVRYLARGRGYLFFLTPSETVLTVRHREEPPRPLGSREISDLNSRGTARASWSQAVLRFALEGANPHARMEARDRLPGISNYFIGNDPSMWRTHIPNYEKVIHHGIYPGIDAAYYGKEGWLESDFLVSPGRDPSVIRIKISGARRMETNAAGDLVLALDSGEVKLAKPVLYQEVKGERKLVAGGYRLLGGNQIGFDAGPYDRRRPLVIDPTLVYSTYLGGSGSSGDLANAIAVDSAGEAYVTGSTTSPDFPTASPFQAALGGTGATNVFVTKFSASGTALIFSTYLGGSGADLGNGIALDSSGDAYVTGSTNSSNFPVVPNTSSLTGSQNAFVTKLSPSGSALLFSTYLGGNSFDVANAIAVDASGNAFVAGNTNSTNFPVTSGVFQNMLNPVAVRNAFVAEFSPTGTVTWATYLGGSGSDTAFGIAVDSSGNVHVTGLTSSPDFPMMNAFQSTLGGNGIAPGNAFVSELNSTGSALIFSTYLGGSLNDEGVGIAVDSSGNTIVAGVATSTDFPLVASLQAHDPVVDDLFVAKFDPSGNLVLSTLFGDSSGFTDATAVALDGSGNIYLTGHTTALFLPTLDPLQGSTQGSNQVAFVVEMKFDGSDYLFSTFLGGTTNGLSPTSSPLDSGNGIAVDTGGNIYVAGLASTSDFPTVSPFQPSLNSTTFNGFVAKISPTTPTGPQVFPSNLNLGTSSVGSASIPQVVTISNGTNSLTFSGITIIGPNAADFSEADSCSLALPPRVVCTVAVTATPSATGTRTATLQINDSDPSSPQTVPLIAVGVTPGTVTISPPSLALPSTEVSVGSAGMTVMVNNTGSIPVTITMSTIGANPVDFITSGPCPSPFTLAPGASCSLTVTFTPMATGSRTASLQFTGNFTGSPTSVSLSGTGTPAMASLTPPSLSFGNQVLNTTSAAQVITLTNTSRTLTLSNIVITSGDPQFGFTTSCGNALGPGMSCTISVTYTPSFTGSGFATITVTDTDPALQSVNVAGNGVNATATLAPITTTTLPFARQNLGTTSAPLSLSLQNLGNAALTFTAMLGGANPADFAESDSCNGIIPPGGFCNSMVTFTPMAGGLRSAIVTYNSTTASVTGVPQSVMLMGTGVAATTAVLDPTSLIFPAQPAGVASPPQVVTFANTGNRPLFISATSISGPNAADFSVSFPSNFATVGCGGFVGVGLVPVNPQVACPISFVFRPSLTGLHTATFTIMDSSSNSPHTLTLMGGAAPAPAVSLSPASLNFVSVPQGTSSAPMSGTLTNTGTALLSISSVAVTGPNAADFAIGSGTTCVAGATVGFTAPSNSCQFNVTFKPSTPTTESAMLTFTDNATPTTQVVSLSGSVGTPAVTLSPTSVTFPGQTIGTASAPLAATLTNSGTAALNLSSVALSGPNAADFAIAPGTTCIAALTIAFASPLNTCLVNLTFTPSAVATESATLTFTDGATPNTQVVSLSGTGVGAPAVTLSSTSVTFPGQIIGTASAPLTVTLTNTGTAPLSISSVAVTGPNAADFAIGSGTTCVAGATVGFTAPSNSCQFNVTFKPSTPTTESAMLTFTDNATPTTQVVSLSGSVGTPAVTLSPTSVTFPGQTIGTASTPLAATLTNSGTAALNLSSVALSGPNAADFAIAPGTTCIAALTIAFASPLNTCLVNLTFTPSAVATESATLTFTDNATPTTQTVSLSGTGTVPPGFTLAATGTGNSTVATINAGDMAQFTVVLTPTAGFIGTLNFSCSNLPPHALCQIPPSPPGAPTSVAITGTGPVALRVNVQTNSLGASTAPRLDPGLPGPLVSAPMRLFWGATLLVLMSLRLVRRLEARNGGARWAIGLALVLLAVTWAGCGGGTSPQPLSNQPSTPSGNYVVTLTGTTCSSAPTCPGGVTQSLSLTLRVL